MRFETLHRRWRETHVHDEVGRRDWRHGEKVGFYLHHVLDCTHLLRGVLGQYAILPDHVHVPHRTSRAELEDRVHVARQHAGLLPDRLADRLHGKQEEEGNTDQDRDQHDPHLVAQEVAQTKQDHPHWSKIETVEKTVSCPFPA